MGLLLYTPVAWRGVAVGVMQITIRFPSASEQIRL